MTAYVEWLNRIMQSIGSTTVWHKDICYNEIKRRATPEELLAIRNQLLQTGTAGMLHYYLRDIDHQDTEIKHKLFILNEPKWLKKYYIEVAKDFNEASKY